ncbi:hypothetical protein HK413_05105 [Mucilaginibacter sp. S1162]|uniref:Uncharacterized protein n=1 Tax=Mucilaginibacter humi TaxID=2732510 RepID=A0ABX1W253_9SPHI|nr:hypothetical protein [Mucilaginibacter humi]NNU33678.1 hypothetical protein [Mucilaginibacter humi]
MIKSKDRPGKSEAKKQKLLALTMLTFAASIVATTVKAQTFAEWFRQKSTQKKYLLQQIAALQVYAAYYRAGNNIAHNGLGSITGSLSLENALHRTYYTQLQTVNPAIKDNKAVGDILQWQKDILSRMGNPDKTANLTADEQQYIIQVKNALYQDCDEQLMDLQNVVADNKLQMSDEERFRRIGVIHIAMQSNYWFASVFSGRSKSTRYSGRKIVPMFQQKRNYSALNSITG